MNVITGGVRVIESRACYGKEHARSHHLGSDSTLKPMMPSLKNGHGAMGNKAQTNEAHGSNALKAFSPACLASAR
jgi:hypothetical protein